jgi:hypothetical protein
MLYSCLLSDVLPHLPGIEDRESVLCASSCKSYAARAELGCSALRVDVAQWN